MPDGNITAVIQGRKRFELDEMIETDPYYKARIKDYVEVCLLYTSPSPRD